MFFSSIHIYIYIYIYSKGSSFIRFLSKFDDRDLKIYGDAALEIQDQGRHSSSQNTQDNYSETSITCLEQRHHSAALGPNSNSSHAAVSMDKHTPRLSSPRICQVAMLCFKSPWHIQGLRSLGKDLNNAVTSDIIENSRTRKSLFFFPLSLKEENPCSYITGNKILL